MTRVIPLMIQSEVPYPAPITGVINMTIKQSYTVITLINTFSFSRVMKITPSTSSMMNGMHRIASEAKFIFVRI